MISEVTEQPRVQPIKPGEDPELDAKQGAGTQRRIHEESIANVQAYLQERTSGAPSSAATPQPETRAMVDEAAANEESRKNLVTYYKKRLRELYPDTLITDVVPNLDELQTFEEVTAAKEKLVAAKRAS